MRRTLSIERPRRRAAGADSGFTLLELVVTMVLIGILGAVVAMFGNPIRAGIDGQRRAELADAADTAYRRMARDLRRALPNSIRVVGSTLELIPTKNGGRYVDVADGGGNYLSFTDAGKLTFDFGGADPDASVAIANNDFMVISNWGIDPANAYCAGDTCNNRTKISVSGNTITMAANPYPALGADYASPGSRFQLVAGAERAVTYDCSGGSLTRRWNYGFNGEAGGSQALLAKNIQCSFNYVQFNDVNLWGLVHLQFSMASSDLPGETVTLVYQLHVNNTP